MKNTHDAKVILTPQLVERTVAAIRADEVLGDECSSWSTVCPTEWEATDRLRMLVEEDYVAVTVLAPAAIVRALREFEASFLA